MNSDRLACLIRKILPWRSATAEFARFSAVGAFNFFLDFGVYIGLTRGCAFWGRHIILAAAVSFVVAVISSFILNTFWTFRCSASGWPKRAWKFFLVACGGLGLNALVLYVLTRLGVYDLLAKLAATALVLFWNYTLQKKWTFHL